MPTLPCPPTGAPSQRSPTGWFTSGVDRSRGAARRQGCRGHAWRGTAPGGSLRLESSIPGQSSALTFEPEAGAQCVSSARWDLCGGRPEASLAERPHQVKGRPYRERANSASRKTSKIRVVRGLSQLNGVQEVASSDLSTPTSSPPVGDHFPVVATALHCDGLCHCPPNPCALLIMCLFSDDPVSPGSSPLLAGSRQQATGVPRSTFGGPG